MKPLSGPNNTFINTNMADTVNLFKNEGKLLKEIKSLQVDLSWPELRPWQNKSLLGTWELAGGTGSTRLKRVFNATEVTSGCVVHSSISTLLTCNIILRIDKDYILDSWPISDIFLIYFPWSRGKGKDSPHNYIPILNTQRVRRRPGFTKHIPSVLKSW